MDIVKNKLIMEKNHLSHFTTCVVHETFKKNGITIFQKFTSDIIIIRILS